MKAKVKVMVCFLAVVAGLCCSKKIGVLAQPSQQESAALNSTAKEGQPASNAGAANKENKDIIESFRSFILKSYGGVEPSFFESLRPKANELFEKIKELVEKSDAENVEPQFFNEYLLKWINNNASGHMNVLSKDAFCDLSSSGPDMLRLNYHAYGDGNEIKAKLERFLSGQVFEPIDNLHNLDTFCMLPGLSATRLYSYCGVDDLFCSKVKNEKVGVKYDVGPGIRGCLGVLVDLSKTSIVSNDEISNILQVLFYDRPEILGLDKIKYAFNGSRGTHYTLNSIMNMSTSTKELLNEAFKEAFGHNIDECFELFKPIHEREKAKRPERHSDVGQDFSFFVSNLCYKYKPFSDVLRKQYQKSTVPNHHNNKFLAVLISKDVCARLLGYQAVVSYGKGYAKDIAAFAAVDPGCLNVCCDIETAQEISELKDIFAKMKERFK